MRNLGLKKKNGIITMTDKIQHETSLVVFEKLFDSWLFNLHQLNLGFKEIQIPIAFLNYYF
jgi:hypothetical protein